MQAVGEGVASGAAPSSLSLAFLLSFGASLLGLLPEAPGDGTHSSTCPPTWPTVHPLFLPTWAQAETLPDTRGETGPDPSHLLQQVTNASDDWTISGIPANQHHLTLTSLDPGSLYEVEMAAYNCAGEGQTAMVTFRTGKVKRCA